MFVEGEILYFDPFNFPDGGHPKPKYFLVLKKLKGSLILASLPTSKDSVPSYIPKIHGCINNDSINFNCYYFEPTRKVAFHSESGTHFSFPKETYVYGFRINEFDTDDFKAQIRKGVTSVCSMGILYEQEFNAIINCLKSSGAVKNKYKKIL